MGVAATISAAAPGLLTVPAYPGEGLTRLGSSVFCNQTLLELTSYGVEMPVDELRAVFAALADPTRRAILHRLPQGDANVAELAVPFAMSQPATSKHLKVLERAGLITRAPVATARFTHLEA